MLDLLNDLIWSKLLIVMLIGLGLFFTIASRFVQFRYFGSMFRIFSEAFQRQPGQLSSFQRSSGGAPLGWCAANLFQPLPDVPPSVPTVKMSR